MRKESEIEEELGCPLSKEEEKILRKLEMEERLKMKHKFQKTMRLADTEIIVSVNTPISDNLHKITLELAVEEAVRKMGKQIQSLKPVEK